MKRIFFVAIFCCVFSLVGRTQDNSNGVGIFEQLDKTIPKDLKFIDENLDTVTLGSLINKPTILSFVYFDCPGLCSPLLQGVSTLIEESDLTLGTDYDVITISFNYKDTPEKAIEKKNNFLQQHSQQHAKNWHYLTTDSATINKIIAAVGYGIKQVGLDWAHPSAIIIVSPDGKITRYLYGLSYLPFDFKMAVVEAEKGLSRPTVHKVMKFCFSYDPEGKRYGLDVTKIAATIIIFFALVLLITLIIKSRRKSVNDNL